MSAPSWLPLPNKDLEAYLMLQFLYLLKEGKCLFKYYELPESKAQPSLA